MKSRKVKAYNASKRRKVDIPLEASDDSDVDTDSFFHDEIDDFNNEKDEEASTDDELIQKKNDSSEEEEVLPITDDEKEESEDDEKASESEDDDLPNRDAWGKKKSTYYSADFVDQDRGKTYREEDAEAAKAEEEEALAIQKSVYHSIKTDNLSSLQFLESSEESAEEGETIKKDGATKQEIINYLKKETKIFEYKALCEEVFPKLYKVLKLWDLVQKKRIQSKKLELYIRAKKQIILLIIFNTNMYLWLLSTGKCSKYHPVHQRIAQFKQLLDKLELTDEVLQPMFDQILAMKEEEVDIASDPEYDAESTTQSMSVSSSNIPVANGIGKKRKKKIKQTETKDKKLSLIEEVFAKLEKGKLSKSEKMNAMEEDKDQPINEEDVANIDGKRIISYEIAKNKGLVPHRKKEYRNPRVRHREKYRKAQIRRKGQVHNVIKEIKRYEGEPTGINTNVVKSIKFK